MHTNTRQISLFDRIWAAFIFFTRLPFWRIYQPSKESYKSVVEFWPLTGWLTGGLTAATLYIGSMCLPYAIAVLMAIALRLLITGALHEDGLADFFDGFGGGTDRQRILVIMKDSHIGTFGVLALILYFALLFTTLLSLNPSGTSAAFSPLPIHPPLLSHPSSILACLAIIAADPFAKMLSAALITLPYARSEESSKAKNVYRPLGWKAVLGLALQGLAPMALFIYMVNSQWSSLNVQCSMFNVQCSMVNVQCSMFNGQCSMFILLLPCLVFLCLYSYIRHRLQGYTGDCCGAVCLMVELTTLLAMSALIHN